MRDEMEDSPVADEAMGTTYRSAVGSLIFYGQDRAYIQLEIGLLGQYLKTPTEGAFKALKRLVRYLIGTKEMEIVMRMPKNVTPGVVLVEGYGDADWAGDKVTRKSRSSGHIVTDSTCPMTSVGGKRL